MSICKMCRCEEAALRPFIGLLKGWSPQHGAAIERRILRDKWRPFFSGWLHSDNVPLVDPSVVTRVTRWAHGGEEVYIMTTLNHPLPRSGANGTSNERDEERCILRYIESGSLREYTYILPSSRTGGRVREIGGLQFPMDNGTLITPWRRASCQVARRAINGWRGI